MRSVWNHLTYSQAFSRVGSHKPAEGAMGDVCSFKMFQTTSASLFLISLTLGIFLVEITLSYCNLMSFCAGPSIKG